MEQIRIYPDFNMLKTYYPNFTEDVILHLNREGVTMSDTFNEEYSAYIIERFKTVAKKYFVLGHVDELLCLIFSFLAHSDNFLEVKNENFKDDRISIEVAKFLLTYRRNEEVGDIRLSIKSSDGTNTITNNKVSMWMCKLISDAIESGKIPHDIFGDKIFYNLYGMNPEFGKIDIKRLEETSKLKLNDPNKLKQKIVYEFYNHLLPYLNEHTILAIPNNLVLPNRQSNFFYDLFSILGLVENKGEKITNAKYFQSLIKNFRTPRTAI